MSEKCTIKQEENQPQKLYINKYIIKYVNLLENLLHVYVIIYLLFNAENLEDS